MVNLPDRHPFGPLVTGLCSSNCPFCLACFISNDCSTYRLCQLYDDPKKFSEKQQSCLTVFVEPHFHQRYDNRTNSIFFFSEFQLIVYLGLTIVNSTLHKVTEYSNGARASFISELRLSHVSSSAKELLTHVEKLEDSHFEYVKAKTLVKGMKPFGSSPLVASPLTNIPTYQKSQRHQPRKSETPPQQVAANEG